MTVDKAIINQILNNFKNISKLYIKITETEINGLHLFALNDKDRIDVYASEIDPPYYSDSPRGLLYYLFNSNAENFTLYINDKSYTLDKKLVAFVIGLLEFSNYKINYTQAINEGRPFIAYYHLCVDESISIFDRALILYYTGFLNDAISELEKDKTDRALILKSKIYRKLGDIKKSLEVLVNVKSNELEIERNIEYAWLHFTARKYENAYKIFSYYKNTSGNNIQEILYGLGLSFYNMDENNMLSSISLFKKAIELKGPYIYDLYLTVADFYYLMKDFLKSCEYYEKAFELRPSPDILYKILKCNINLNRYSIVKEKLLEIALFKNEYFNEIVEKIKGKVELNNIANPKFKYFRSGETANNEDDPLKMALESGEKDIKNASDSIKKPVEIIENKESFEKISAIDSIQQETWQEKESQDEFYEMAFNFAREIEEEFNKKVYFNYDGLNDLERKLRISMMTEISEMEKINIIRGSCAFLSFFIKERFKASIVKYENLDPWAWPVYIKTKKGIELVTYPNARIWQLLWRETLPEQGWIKSYVNYLMDFYNNPHEIEYGKEAVRKKVSSHKEKIFDAQIEHKKILEVASDLKETYSIPLNSSGLMKLENEIKKRYSPDAPPTTEGWKLLRCYAHIFLEIVLKDFKPEWFNVEKNDGLWSFKLQSNIYIFPVGKVYKVASYRESLIEYYETLSRNYKNISR